MSNDYLRLDGDDRLIDSSVNEYSVKNNGKKKTLNNENSAMKLILDEIYLKKKSIGITDAVSNKPKLLSAITFSSILIMFSLILSVITYYTRMFFTLQLTVLCYSAVVPISIIYFFYNLNVNGNVKFSTLSYCTFLGIAVFIIIEVIFTKLVSQALHDYHFYVSVRCLIEMLSVVCISYFVKTSIRGGSYATWLLIAGTVAAGFSFASSLAENFSSLLVEITVSPTGDTVGAIINIEEFIKNSISNAISSFATTSIYNPFIFIALAIIIFRNITNDKVVLRKKIVIVFFTFLFCLITYILSSLKTPFDFLTVLYNLISIIFTVYLFITAINDCVKSEKYE